MESAYCPKCGSEMSCTHNAYGLWMCPQHGGKSKFTNDQIKRRSVPPAPIECNSCGATAVIDTKIFHGSHPHRTFEYVWKCVECKEEMPQWRVIRALREREKSKPEVKKKKGKPLSRHFYGHDIMEEIMGCSLIVIAVVLLFIFLC